MAYTVARRTSEIGIRMALGAERRQITGMVAREALGVTLGGIVVGMGVALLLSRTLATLLFEVDTGRSNDGSGGHRRHDCDGTHGRVISQAFEPRASIPRRRCASSKFY